MAEHIEFDPESVTLGELASAAEASGLPISKLTSSAYSLLLAVFVVRLRNSGQPPSWQEITNLRLLDTSFGPSRSAAGSRSAKSSVSA